MIDCEEQCLVTITKLAKFVNTIPNMKELNELSYNILKCVYTVHTKLGPGLLESTYETCLEYELLQNGFEVKKQLLLPVKYGNIEIDAGYRIDLMVNSKVILELKSVKKIEPIYEAQLLTYLKLSGLKLGLLLNFNVPRMVEGVTRKVM